MTVACQRVTFIAALVVVWYYCSYEYNTRLKAWLSLNKEAGYTSTPAVTASAGPQQFLSSAASSWLSPVTLPLLVAIFFTTTIATLPWVFRAYLASGPTLLAAWRHLWTDHTLDMCLMCASTVMGTATITIVYEYGSIQLVQVARSVGPLFTTGWAVLLLDQTTKGAPLWCLLASLAGTVLASWKEPSLCLMTVVLMVAANACMTFRNVITRRLLTALGIGHGHSHQPPSNPGKAASHAPDACQVSSKAVAGAGDSHVITTCEAGVAVVTAATVDPQDYSVIPSTHMASLLLTTGNAAGCVALVGLVLLGGLSQSRAVTTLLAMPADHIQRLALLGGTNWAYNLASQLVLAQLTVVSHGMLELLKRVFVLVAVSVFAQKANWRWHNILGAAITFAAAALYFYFTHHHKQKHAAASSPRRADGAAYHACRAEEDKTDGVAAGDACKHAAAAGSPVVTAHHVSSPTHHFRVSHNGVDSGPVLVDAAGVVVISKSNGASGGADGAAGECVAKEYVPHHTHQAYTHAAWGCCGVLPPRGPPRVRLARALIVVLMLCSLPLLLPSGFWVGGSGGGSQYELYTGPFSSSSTAVTAPAAADAAAKTEAVFDNVLLFPADGSSAPSQQARQAKPTQPQQQPAKDQPAKQSQPQPQKPSDAKGESESVILVHTQQASLLRGQAALQFAKGGNPAPRKQLQQSPAAVAADGAASSSSGSNNVLYGILMGWLGHDNLGDEIVADIFYELFREALANAAPQGTRVELSTKLDPSLSTRYTGCGKGKAYDKCHFGVIGGGSTVDVPFIQAAKPLLQARVPVLLFGGGHQRVYHDKPLEEESLDLLMKANVLGGLRGPITQEFLMNRTGSTLPIIGDSGFLSELFFPGTPNALPTAHLLPQRIAPGAPVPHWPPAHECLQRRRHSRAHAGMSYNPPSEAPGQPCERPLLVATLRTELTSADLHKDAKHLVMAEDIEHLRVPRHPIAVMMLMIEELVNEHHFQVVLQAVDEGCLTAHKTYIDMINRRIRPGHPLVTLHNEHSDYRSVMELYSRAAVTVNCRLHSGILSAAALRPTVYMASLPKFMDFMRSVDMDFYMVDPNRPDLRALGTIELAKLMVSKVLHATTNAAAISQQLRTVRDDMMQRYQASMKTLVDRIASEQAEAFKAVVQSCASQSIQIARSNCIDDRTVVSVTCGAQ